VNGEEVKQIKSYQNQHCLNWGKKKIQAKPGAEHCFVVGIEVVKREKSR
jgi:hypothetical protein